MAMMFYNSDVFADDQRPMGNTVYGVHITNVPKHQRYGGMVFSSDFQNMKGRGVWFFQLRVEAR